MVQLLECLYDRHVVRGKMRISGIFIYDFLDLDIFLHVADKSFPIMERYKTQVRPAFLLNIGFANQCLQSLFLTVSYSGLPREERICANFFEVFEVTQQRNKDFFSLWPGIYR